MSINKNIVVLLLSVMVITVLSACGNKMSKEELEKKQNFVIMNNFIYDNKTEKEKKAEEKERLSKMDEEQLAEIQVLDELGLSDNTDGTYKTYGIADDFKGYVKDSIKDGLVIPKEGKVVVLDRGDDEDVSTSGDDELNMLIKKQSEELTSAKLERLRKKNMLNESADALIQEKIEEEKEIEENKRELQKEINELEQNS